MRVGRGPARTLRRPERYVVGGRALGGSVVGGLLGVEGFVGDLLLEIEAVAQASSWALVIFLIWWVALRASISGPRVHPLTVLARMTVG